MTAIFYADPGEAGNSLPVNALMILAEFAGAQIDRLIALSGGFADEEVEEEAVQDRGSESPGEAPVEVAAEEPAPAETHIKEPAAVEPHIEESSVEKPAVERSAVEAPAADVHPEVEAVESPLPAPEPPAATTEVALEPSSSVAVAVETLAPPVDAVEPIPSPAETTLEFPPPPEEVVVRPLPPPVEVTAEPSGVVAPVIESEIAPTAAQQAVDVVTSPTSVTPPAAVMVGESPAPSTPAVPADFDVTQLSEAEQKVHKDAKRFAKLLVSEIELYNKAKVADGRKNRDLYKRLKTDIDRSRQTFEKRFGKTLSNQVDYFQDELVKTLAANDSAVLGPDYPGPSA